MALMAAFVGGPDADVLTGRGRPVDNPEMGSTFEAGGQSPRAGFLCLESIPGGPRSSVCDPPSEGTDCCVIVEVDDEDEDEAIDDEEFVRCALLRGINIRETSSALIELIPP